jgi:hypothetical protein
MRARLLVSATLLTLLAAVPHAQQAAAPEPTQLPVRRVVLYKSGVGFFEHQGSVTGSVDVAIQFTSGQLNDVLKSLTALDLDNGQISSIGYNSVAPLEQRLGALRVPLGTQPDLVQFYNALRGARVDVQTGTSTVTGRLLGIERMPRRDNTSEPTDLLTVISNDGTVRSIALRPNVRVRLAERDLRDDIGRYLSVVASGREQDVRRMTLAATGNGSRRLVVSYISEVPIWKSTYRLVLPSDTDDQPVLQGWAVVDNTIGADWTNVELSLVAGAPQSFIQQVSQPYYVRRPQVALPPAVLLTPQTHQATLQVGQGTIRVTARDANGTAMAGVIVTAVDPAGQTIEATTNSRGEADLTVTPGTSRLTMALAGFTTQSREVSVGNGSTVRVTGTMTIGGTTESLVVVGDAVPLVDVQNARQATTFSGAGGGRGAGPQGFLGESQTGGAQINPVEVQSARLAGSPTMARAQDLGDLFEYRMTQPVTIRTNQSALVPIVNARVKAERVSIWNRGAGNGRPLRAVWLTNTSHLTLDGGTLSVIDANAFAGEGLVDALRSNEKRLVSYGSDLGVMVDARLDDSSGLFTRVVARDGVVVAEEESRQRWLYRVRNEDSTPRTLVIEHPIRPGWMLETEPVADEMTAGYARYRVPVAARGEATLRIAERRTGETRYTMQQLDDRVLLSFSQRGVSMDDLRRALQPLADARAQIAAFDGQMQELSNQVSAIDEDQSRIRENLRALSSGRADKGLVDRYTRELAAQEDQLQQLRAQLKTVAAERGAAQTALATLMQKLAFEVGGK